MVVPILYFLLLFGSYALAFGMGGKTERWAATIMAVGSLLTVVVSSPIAVRFRAVDAGVFTIDLAVFVAFVIVARFSDRFWPIWAASLDLLSVWAHVVRAIHPTSRAVAYAFNEQIWSWPILILIALGSVRRWMQTKQSSAGFSKRFSGLPAETGRRG
jgi:hypothetical protein